MKIRRLISNVTVTTGELGSPMGRSEGSPRPTMAFAMAPAEVRAGQGSPQPSETATGLAPDLEGGQTADPRAADPGLIANRVYDLMKAEVRLAISRGDKPKTGWRKR